MAITPTASRAPHGSTARAKANCPCRACDAKRSQLYFQSPRSAQPKTTKRIGSAIVRLSEHVDLQTLVVDENHSLLSPANLNYTEVIAFAETVSLSRGGTKTVTTLYMTGQTYRDVITNDDWITSVQSWVSEVEMKVPHAIKRDLVPKARRDGTMPARVMPGQDPKAPVDLGALVSQLNTVVASLAAGGMPLDVAMKQYGHLRDQIAARRSQFAEAEGAFELLQALIVDRASGL